MSLLEVRGLEVRYGGIRAVKGIDLEIGAGEMVCLIGANGAGKSSTLRAISGLVPTAPGAVRFGGSDLAGAPAFQRARAGTAGTLSGGEQQMLAIGRALMSRPKLLALDEPSMGLAPIVAQKIFEVIRDINHAGVTVLLVEQNARAALALAARAYVMESGMITLSGEARALLADSRVREAYLGEAAP
jgi:branched-chain amino acid transport system ATP-binding protein